MKSITTLTLAITSFLIYLNVDSSETREVGSFDGIEISGNFEVELYKGQEGQIELTGAADQLENIITEVENNQLKIRVKKGRYLKWWKLSKVYIKIPVEEINSCGFSGSGMIKSRDLLSAEFLNLNLSGSAKAYYQIQTDKLNSSISGSGMIQLTGSAKQSSLNVSGSGSIDAKALNTIQTSAQISGSGRITVLSSEELDASISGSGRIRYSGNPQRISSKVSGSGEISTF